jgi:hypothetical protein
MEEYAAAEVLPNLRLQCLPHRSTAQQNPGGRGKKVLPSALML